MQVFTGVEPNTPIEASLEEHRDSHPGCLIAVDRSASLEGDGVVELGPDMIKAQTCVLVWTSVQIDHQAVHPTR
jgi:hypothetical protein